MLNTRFVKFLQSRPYHIRMFIFIFTIATAGVMMISFWLSSLSDTFVAATDNSKVNRDKEVVAIAEKEKLPSLMTNMKANIKDATSALSDLFDDTTDLDVAKEKQSAKKREIKPVKLPVDKQ